jgi:gliding motility-associated-like protein
MKKLYAVFFFLLAMSVTASAQVDCSNIGFEKGTTLGWVSTHGTMTDDNQKTIFSSEIAGPGVANLQVITSLSDNNDPKVPSISMVAPGSTHSIRLGNTVMGGDYSRIKTSYLVPSDNTLFQYKFAVVLQNTTENGRASHAPFQKPGFTLEIYDSNGDPLPCGAYEIQLQGADAVEGFQAVGDIQYRNWTTGAIDLRAYVGKTITIVATAHGCTKERHFGYAYFDAQCVKMELKQQSSCPDENGMITLIAPEGFGKYSWSDGQTGQIIKVKADLGAKYHVKILPVASLDASCELQLDYTLKYQKASAVIDSTICEGQEVAVGDTVYKTTGNYVRVITFSNVCDSTVYLNLKVNPIVRFKQVLAICEGDSVAVGDTLYRTTGIFVKILTAKTGCDSIVTTDLKVNKLELSLRSDLYALVKGDSAQLVTLVEPKGQYTFRWNPPTALSCADCPAPWSKPGQSMRYDVFVTDPDQACKKKARVTVLVKPCEVYVPDAFSPNADGRNEVLLVYAGNCIRRILKMVIYNRWGEVVYQRENFLASDQAGGWNGMYHGLLSAPGAYPYKIQAEFANGIIQDSKGMIQLLR